MARPERPASRVARLAGGLRRARFWRSGRFWTVLLVNGAFIGLYLWSRGGGVTYVRVELNGPRLVASVDGRELGEMSTGTHLAGGVGFNLRRTDRVPSLPKPAGIDWIRVTDAYTGETLFEDDFDGEPDPAWAIERGSMRVDRGVWSSSTGGVAAVGSQEWTNYVVEMKLRNAEEINLFVRRVNAGDTLQIDLSIFRNYRSTFQIIEAGKPVSTIRGAGLELQKDETIRSMVAMLLRPYPVLLGLVAGAVGLAYAAGFGRRRWLEAKLQAAGRSIAESSGTLALILAIWAVALLGYINYVIAGHMPHVPDSVLYIFQAKIFASFDLTADAPPVRESFSIFHPHMDQVIDGRWFSHYPFGHPLFLAVGQLVHAVWLVPPLVGAGGVLLLYAFGRRVYGLFAGLLAAVILLFSPFFQMTASNFMSHNTAAFLILACLFLLTLPARRRLLTLFLSGLALGLLFNTRPLTAVAFMVPLAGLLGYELLRAGRDRLGVLRQDVAFAAGGLLMLGAYFLYNHATTGSFIQSPYAAQGTYSSETFGFGGPHSLAFGLQNERQLFALLLLVANGWPMFAGLGLALLPFVLGARTRWDYFLAACFVSLAGANILYRNAAVMHGPRFWYETLPFLALLTARGAQGLRDVAVDAGRALTERFRSGPGAPTSALMGAAVTLLIVGLIAFSAWGWMLERRDAWVGVPFTPARISALKGFNFTDRRLLDTAGELNLKNALVLVEPCANWWCFGSVFWTNTPELDGDIVWAEQQRNADDIQLLQAFPDRDVYLAEYEDGEIRRATRAEIIEAARAEASAPP
jgi:4-amino-4-deoxy-L-arabinose transferase-like glycosyltransferase